MARNRDVYDRVVERFDQLDPASIQGYLLRVIREKGLLDTIFQTIREGVLIVDRELNIHFVNQAAMDLLGLPADIRERKDPRLNRYLRDLDWSQMMQEHPEQWEKARRQEIEVMYPKHRYLQFYTLPYQLSGRAEAGQEGELSLVAIVLQDITELRQHAETTIESEKLNAITMLAAGVAHEIGNPLNSLMIHLQLLERYFRGLGTEGDHTDAAELLKVAVGEVHRLDSIINQFLKAVRPTPLELVPLILPELISAVLLVLKQEVENRGVRVECEWSGTIPPVMGDETQLKQVFYNVIRNAIQAMPEGGLMRITVDPGDTWLAIHVEDSGKGIAPGDLSNIFSPYYTTRTEGTGLGLVIVERIVREHGGELAVESEVGHGTTMTIRLPLQTRRTRLLDYRSAGDETVETTIQNPDQAP